MTAGVPRKTVLAIKGLVTTPNEFGVYPEGSCSTIENLLSRSANQWIVARDVETLTSIAFVSQVFERLISGAPGVVFGLTSDQSGTPAWRLYQNNGAAMDQFTLVSALSSTGLFDTTGYITPTIARSRLFLNSRRGVIVADYLAPASAGERVLRTAGLVQPRVNSFGTPTGSTLPDGVIVTYSVVHRRVTADGYVLVSTPSVPYRVYFSGSSGSYSINVSWEYTTDLQVGDTVELYRSAGILDPTGEADTGTSMRLVATKTVTSTDVAAKFVNIPDFQPMKAPLYETSGQEIYTSPYQEGSTGANLTPPVCRAMAQWGLYTFYGNITDEPSWTMDVPAGVFDTVNPAADNTFVRTRGIGLRRVTGTRTAGSAVVTAVSAAHLAGIVPGQRADVNVFPLNTTVVSVGASSITMSANTTVPGVGVETMVYDQLEINGNKFLIEDISDLVQQGTAGTSPWLAAFPSETMIFSTGFTSNYTVGTTILFRPNRSGVRTTITVRGTNGANYSPAIPDIAATAQTITQTERPNVLRWSKANQPEAVPSGNEAFVGSGAIIRMLPTTDCLWILCTDGVRRLSGSGGVWRIDLVDPTFIPIAPDACCVHNDVLYAYTPRGICSLSGTTTTLISRGVLDAEFPALQFSADKKIHLYVDPTNEELIVLRQNAASLTGASTIFVYSLLYQQWSTYVPSTTPLTCIGTFQPAAASTPAYPVFGWYGGAVTVGSIRSWRSDSGTPLDPVKLYLQPLYLADPLTNKRWIDVTWIGGAAGSVATSIDQYVDTSTGGGYSGGGLFVATAAGETRCSIGVTRARAIAPTLRLLAEVHNWPSAAPSVFKGLSVRVVPLTTQQKQKA